jgi:hypothetical protein
MDNIFVNRWSSGDKTVFTVLNMKHEGFEGKLFMTGKPVNKHYVSLWHHENLVPETAGESVYISARTNGWPSSGSGTRREGSVDCIANCPI